MKDHNCYLFIVFTTLLSVLQEGKKLQQIQCVCECVCVRLCVRFSFVRSLIQSVSSLRDTSSSICIINFIWRREKSVQPHTQHAFDHLDECMHACMRLWIFSWNDIYIICIYIYVYAKWFLNCGAVLAHDKHHVRGQPVFMKDHQTTIDVIWHRCEGKNNNHKSIDGVREFDFYAIKNAAQYLQLICLPAVRCHFNAKSLFYRMCVHILFTVIYRDVCYVFVSFFSLIAVAVVVIVFEHVVTWN